MEKINKTLDKFNHGELMELQKLIKEEAMGKIIEKRLEKFKNGNKVCPVCNTSIEEEGFMLIFGTSGFRKKATFDGLDCLEYFITKLKE